MRRPYGSPFVFGIEGQTRYAPRNSQPFGDLSQAALNVLKSLSRVRAQFGIAQYLDSILVKHLGRRLSHEEADAAAQQARRGRRGKGDWGQPEAFHWQKLRRVRVAGSC
jgi:hypothetical protein